MASADVLSKWSLLIQSSGINNTQSVESFYTQVPASGTDTRAMANHLGNLRANLLGKNSALVGIRYSTYSEASLGSGYGQLARLSQTIYRPSTGVSWAGSNTSGVSGLANAAAMHSAGAHVTRQWKGPDGNVKSIAYSMAFPPLVLSRDEVSAAQCTTDYTASQAAFVKSLSVYTSFLQSIQVIERTVQPGNIYAVTAFTNSDSTTSPATNGTVTLVGSGLGAIFAPGTIISILSRSHKGKRSLPPELSIRGTKSVVSATPTSTGIILGLSCTFSGKSFDPCIQYSVRPHIVQHSTLYGMTFDGYGKPRRGGSKSKKF